jgi:ABC-type transporter Mla maintaining outer membrane lipid asymmetry ATPase subunit MlaF
MITSIRFENVGFAYEGSAALFSEFNAELPVGKNIIISGPAGNGQSTFLKMLVLLLQPQTGKFLINEQNTTDMSFEEFQPMRSKIGYTFDLGGLFSNRTLLDNLTLPLLYHKIYTPENAVLAATEIAERFRFSRVLGLRPASVSGGLRKTVCVLRAMLLKPELLVMDDPFTGMDSVSSRELITMISELRSEGIIKHIFMTSREEHWVKQMGCEKLILETDSGQTSLTAEQVTHEQKGGIPA